MGVERPAYDEKLASIMRAAAAIFAEKGYHQASVRDISRATGVSLAGLYHYFRSKEELLFLIQDHCFATVLAQLDRQLAGVADPERRLRLMIRNHLHFFANNMKEMKVLSHEAESLSGDFRVQVNARKRRYADICTAILRELRPSADERETRTAAFALFGMLNWIYNWYQPGRDLAVTELAERMCQLFLRGYLAADTADVVADDTLTEAAPSIWRR
jgi:TetR/AcrR family transcriptional regulator, cholesterol catabolism regulator